MRKYTLSPKEIQYIQKKFIKTKQLLGVKRPPLFVFGAKETLEQKGIIIQNNGKRQLRADVMDVFQSWKRKHYSAVISDDKAKNRENPPVVLWNSEGVIVLAGVGKQYTIKLVNDSDATSTIASLINVDESILPQTSFSVRYSVSEAADMLTAYQKKKDLSKWAANACVDEATLTELLKVLDGKDDGSFALVEDHVGNIGAMTRYIKTPNGIVSIKHTTPAGKEGFVDFSLTSKEKFIEIIKKI